MDDETTKGGTTLLSGGGGNAIPQPPRVVQIVTAQRYGKTGASLPVLYALTDTGEIAVFDSEEGWCPLPHPWLPEAPREDGAWRCKRCSVFDNPREAKQCYICGTPKT